ncbi:MAG: DUF1343 domain-containing protein [Pirellulales bacterium]|nr:DUF1343 domain-containing protein [Pirellulales bacterium]
MQRQVVRRPVADASTPEVLCGVDVLKRDGFRQLAGKRVGLITNHTGVDRTGKTTIDLLHEAPDVTLAAIFSPEHGIAGRLDQPDIGDAQHEPTGTPIYSLYGKTNRPAPAHLAELDVLAFDVQDVGTRFYTYVSTMGLAMEAAAEAEIMFVVLDRPNPIGGTAVEGPVRDPDGESFIAHHDIPVRHGMTAGELALMFAAERKVKVELLVVPVEGWRRGATWDRTGLVWINPSPNMRSLMQAMLYPGVGLLEFSNLSVGRGTDTPFEIIGAPWIEPRDLAASLNAAQVPGVRFIPVRFTPTASRFANQECGGVQLHVVNRNALAPVELGLTLACTLRKLYPETWEAEKMDRLLRHAAVLAAIRRGVPAPELRDLYESDLKRFRERRKEFLLYER